MDHFIVTMWDWRTFPEKIPEKREGESRDKS